LLGVSRREVDEAVTLEATFLAAEILSRATSVTGAALVTLATDDHDPGYQLYNMRKSISQAYLKCARQSQYSLHYALSTGSQNELGHYWALESASPRRRGSA
jgi:hypothetical protein